MIPGYHFQLGDVVETKKPHPCGSNRWEVTRLGADIGSRCLGCGHYVMMPRRRFERAVRRVVSGPSTGRQ